MSSTLRSTQQVLSRAGFLQTWCLGLRFIRSESEGDFLLIPGVISCVFTEERIEFGHTATKPRSVECCSDVCPSVDFSYLHIWSWSSTRVTIRFLVTTLDKVLLNQLLSLARRPALGRVPVVPNVFHLWMRKVSVLWDLQCPRSVPRYNLVSEVYRQFLGLHGLVCSLTCTVNCGTLYREVCAFQNHVQSTEFTTGGPQSSCRNISRILSGNRMLLSSILSIMAKAVNTYIHVILSFFIFYKFA